MAQTGAEREAKAPWVRALKSRLGSSLPQSVMESPSGSRSRCLAATGISFAKVTRAGGPGQEPGERQQAVLGRFTAMASLPAKSRLWEARGQMLGASTEADGERAVGTAPV